MKNILLPTDLTVQSLWAIQKLVEEANGEKLNIHLVHVLHIPSDFYELIGIGKANPRAMASQNFIEAYEMLRNKHKSVIEKLNLEFIYGSSKRVIINYMQGNKIDEICLLSNYFYQFKLNQSVDFIAHLKKSNFPINSFPLQIENVTEYQTFSTLLNGNNGLREIVKTNQRPVFSEILEN
jgi:hypothetical protein